MFADVLVDSECIYQPGYFELLETPCACPCFATQMAIATLGEIDKVYSVTPPHPTRQPQLWANKGFPTKPTLLFCIEMPPPLPQLPPTPPIGRPEHCVQCSHV